MLFKICACIFACLVPVRAFSRGAPDFTCKDPSTFHTQKVNSTHEGIIMPENMTLNPYSVDVEVLKYGPGDKVTVTFRSNDKDRPLRGFFLQAVQANIHLRDLRRRAFGVFENTTADEKPSVCQAYGPIPTSGITHSNAKGKQSVTVTWIAPSEYNPGDIHFLATGVQDYYTYWTDIRSKPITAEGYAVPSENSSTGSYTPTAAWFRWLQYLRQQLLLKQNLGLPITAAQGWKGAGLTHVEAGHDHHHHHHDHDHAHDHMTETTSLVRNEPQTNDTLNFATLLEENTVNVTESNVTGI